MACQRELKKQGLPYPRTCADCGLLGKCYVEFNYLKHAVKLLIAWHEMDHDAMEPSEIQKRYDEAINAAKAAATWMEEGK